MKYFVRASGDAPAKGPFDRDALRKSLDKGLLKPEAEVRAEDSGDWVTLKSFFKPEDDAKTNAETAEIERAMAVQNMARRNERARAGANVTVGIVMVVVGLGLSAASLSAGHGGGVFFFGLILLGIIRIIRGLAAR